MSNRDALFISHATPEDNPFAIWLGARLAAAGYEVFADVLSIRGGNDWARILEDAIRNRACKVLFAANEISVQKQGVRNEIQIASETANKIGDSDFIIPLRLRPYQAPFSVVQAQYIDFERGWAAGLTELLETLSATYEVPRTATNADKWLDLQLMYGKKLVEESGERLTSTWLEVRHLPKYFYFYPDPKSISTNFPTVPYKDGILTCDARGKVRGRVSCVVTTLLRNGWPGLELGVDEARKVFANVANRSLDDYFRVSGLKSYELSGKQVCWWVDDVGPKTKVQFKWPESAGSRKIQGVSLKQNVRWHFGVSAFYRAIPLHHFRLKSRLLFTQDGKIPLTSAARAHRLRRSFAKGWRNARWRDMLLSFLFWLSGGTTFLEIPVSSDDAIVVSLPTMIFSCPITVEDKDEEEDEEDPDIEYEDGEDEEEDDETPDRADE